MPVAFDVQPRIDRETSFESATPLSTQLAASFATAVRDYSPFGKSIQFVKHQIAKREDDILEPEQLNKQYPGMERPSSEKMSSSMAKSMWENQQDRKLAQELINNGRGTWTETVANFGVSMIPLALDPISYMAGHAVGVGLSAAAGRAVVGGKYTEMVRKSLQTAGGFARSVGEGMLGNVHGYKSGTD